MARTSGAQDGQLIQTLQASAEMWQAFDYQNKLSSFLQTANQIKEQKESSSQARKLLADTTKQFKRSVKAMEQTCTALKENFTIDASGAAVKSMENLGKECRGLVKSYQEEIDNLTRRSKASEGAFSTLFAGLQDAPDPASLLSSALEQIFIEQSQMDQLLTSVDKANREITKMDEMFSVERGSMQKEIDMLKKAKSTDSSSGANKEEREELVQLRREVAEYEVEFRSLKNQDITIRKLEAKIQEMQETSKGELEKELSKAQQDLAETEGRRAAEALEREAAMERRVHSLELQLNAERAGREATHAHLLDQEDGAGEREAAWEAQRRILVDDAERLRETLHGATRERDELRLRVGALEGSGFKTGRTPPPSGGLAMSDMILERKAYQAEVSELSHATYALREELRLKEDAIAEERRTLQAKIDFLQHERNALSSEVANLDGLLAAAPPITIIENMKRELRILKRLEYNAEDGDHEPETTGVTQDDDLESVLVAKLRRVDSELVRERNSKVEALMECEQLRKDLAEAHLSQAEADALVSSLEADLQRAISAPYATMSQKKVAPFAVRAPNPADLQHVLDPEAPAPPLDTAMPNEGDKVEEEHSVASIVMAQRDRLRARCESLESERDAFKRELQNQVQATESLKADNTKLYEKVRYLQNFNQTGARGVAFNRNSERDLDLEALEQRYEASVDPFRQFSRTERQRKMKDMSPMERIVFMVAKTVLGSKEMRTALFFYVIGLHILVFTTTYHWSDSTSNHSDHGERLSHLSPIHHQQLIDAVNAAAPVVPVHAESGASGP